MSARRWAAALLLALLALPGAAFAQRIDMPSAYASFAYPDSWLVVSPQRCAIYAPLLREAGLDPQALAQELKSEGVHSRAYNADFSQCLSVLTRETDLSAEIFDIATITDAQRSRLRRAAENNALWERTGLRAQDVEWQRVDGDYWLYIHYIRTVADQTVGRGLRYVTVKNGMLVMLDWQITSGRFSNQQLKAFRARLADLTVTQTLKEPVRPVTLKAEIPSETNTAALTITGQTTPNATLVVEAPDAAGVTQTLSVGEANASGAFSLLVELPREGAYAVTLTASKANMLDARCTGTISYSAKKLPVSGIEEAMTTAQDSVTITGRTLPGAQLQLVSPIGLTKKRAGNDGSFSFELTTEEEGDHRYTLILDRDGYDQRRVQFTITRVVTDEQSREAVRKRAVKISYKNLQKARQADQGAILRLYGPVTQVSSAAGVYYARMFFNKDANGRWYNPVVIVAEADMGVKAGDMLTAVVTVAGIYQEQDEQGNDINVPRLELVFVDAIE